jgi:hypothetical protein
MKRFTAILIAVLLVISVFGVSSAFAGASIGGNSTVYPGKTYTIKVSVTENASSIGITSVTCGGVFSGGPSNGWKDSGSGMNQKITASTTITVSVPANAKVGDKGTITVNYQVSTFDGTNVGSFSDSKTKTYTVGDPSKASSDDSPKATKAPTEWDIAKQNVQAMETGGTVTVDITKDPKIPASLLSSIKEKQGVLTLNYGGYTCTINGAALANIPEKMDPIDFSVSMEKDEALSSALGGQDAYQLHFAHSGQLPGKFAYTFKAEGHAPGDILYLYYYYDQSGVIEGMQSAQVDANGFISFDIYHCSSYFVSANAIEGATGRDFTADAANAQALSEAQAQIETLQTQLTEAQAENKELQTQLDSYKAQPSSSPELIAANASAPAGELFGIPYVSFIAAMLGVALITMLFTMMACRAGIFKKKKRSREDIL